MLAFLKGPFPKNALGSLRTFYVQVSLPCKKGRPFFLATFSIAALPFAGQRHK